MMNLLHAGFSAEHRGPIAVAPPWGPRPGKSSFPLWAPSLRRSPCLTGRPFPAPETAAPGDEGGLALLRQPVLILLCVVIILTSAPSWEPRNWVSEYFVASWVRRVHRGLASAPSGSVSCGRSFLWVTWRSGSRRSSCLVLSHACIAALLASSRCAAERLSRHGGRLRPRAGLLGIYPLGVGLAGRVFRSSAAVGMIGTSRAGILLFPVPAGGDRAGSGSPCRVPDAAVLPLGIAATSLC